MVVMERGGEAIAAGNRAREEVWLRRLGSLIVVTGPVVLRTKRFLIL
jgi:hypothetical protein